MWRASRGWHPGRWRAQGAEDGESRRLLAEAVEALEYLTTEADFEGGGRGNPPPFEMTPEQRRAVGLDRETWQLEVIADPESNVQIENPLSKELGTALDWSALMALAKDESVRYIKAMTCLNVDRVFGTVLWEGVPLRNVIWMTRPTGNLRRVWYHGYHNDPKSDQPAPGFQSSLSINRVLEDPPGEHPVILAYKMNGDWLAPERGGPVRLIVPDGYGFKSIKWLQRVVLTNNPVPNDTYAGQNNDVDTTMKTFARFLCAEKAQRQRTGSDHGNRAGRHVRIESSAVLPAACRRPGMRQGRNPTGCYRTRRNAAPVGRSISWRENNIFTVSRATVRGSLSGECRMARCRNLGPARSLGRRFTLGRPAGDSTPV